mmetsp:Transcript_207/g.342  ORF Transcript_207/g.342 Transcript_207/m.342 type:complete len:433 (-) Transcript_207:368-1666(-)
MGLDEGLGHFHKPILQQLRSLAGLHHFLQGVVQHGPGQLHGVPHELHGGLGELHRHLHKGPRIGLGHSRLLQGRPHHRLQLLHRQSPQVLSVHPLELEHVKYGRRLHNAVQLEATLELLARVDLLVSAIVPSQKREIVHHCILGKSLLLELVHRGSSMALAELAAVLPQDQRAVRISGPRHVQGVQDQALAQGVGQVLLGPDDVGDAHHGVVHRHAEVVHRYPGGAQKDEVPHRGLCVPGHPAAHLVLDDHHLALGHFEAHGVGLPGVQPPLHLLGVGVPPGAVVLGGAPLCLRLLSLGIKLLLSTEARVSMTSLHQLLRHIFVDLAPLGLAVGPLVAPHVRPLVPVQAQPPEVVQHALLRLPGATSLICILNAKHKLSTFVAGLEVVEEGSAGTPHVQGAGGGRGKAHTNIAACGLDYWGVVHGISSGKRI